MFGRHLFRRHNASVSAPKPAAKLFAVEALEERRLLSASVVHHAAVHAVHHATAKHAALKHHAAKTTTTSTSSTTSTSTGTTSTNPGDVENTIPFSELSSTIQKGLVTLAAKDSLAVPTSTQTVYLGNSNGIESYTLDYTSSGTTTRITVDQNGNAITAPTQTTETWETLSGTAAGSDAAAAKEISAIVTALDLTAPTDTTTVYITTPTDGTAIYTVHLDSASTTTTTASTTADHGPGPRQGNISVDANGLPVGNETVPFSVIPTAIQNGFNNNLPTGVSALDTTSTQNVNIRTIDGVTLFSTTFTSSGTSTTVTLNSSGTLTSLPTETTASFSDIPLAVQAELQTLATADGYSGTLSSSQSVQVYTEANGTVIYSISVSATNSSSDAVTVTISVDQNGNPTPAPGHGGGGCQGMGGMSDNLDAMLTGGWGGADFGAVDFGLSSYGGGHF